MLPVWVKITLDRWMYLHDNERRFALDHVKRMGVTLSNYRDRPEICIFTAQEALAAGGTIRGVTEAGYYASWTRHSKWVGPFETLRMAQDVALYIQSDIQG